MILRSGVSPICVLILTQLFTNMAPQEMLFTESPVKGNSNRPALCVRAHIEVHVFAHMSMCLCMHVCVHVGMCMCVYMFV